MLRRRAVAADVVQPVVDVDSHTLHQGRRDALRDPCLVHVDVDAVGLRQHLCMQYLYQYMLCMLSSLIYNTLASCSKLLRKSSDE